MKATNDSAILDDPKQSFVTAFHESEHDKGLMKPEPAIMDLPDVKDIPGQEYIKVMPFGEIAGVTIASDDEEGVGILDFDDDDDEDFDNDIEKNAMDDETTDADITPEEIELLDEGGPVETDSDTDNLNRSKLDDTDMEGELLNEAGAGASNDGSELDVAGTELDDENEAIGEEDEENNMYSVADTE
ncbi:hypothetical protein BH10BAC3_BH10BAC3_07680 [soil metagenome]